MAGYSGTPLAKKLGLKQGTRLRPVGAPDGYQDLLEPIPSGVEFVSSLSDSTDIIHLFTSQRDHLQTLLTTYRTNLKPTGTIWVSWPKKSARIPTDITEDTIREVALPLGFVDVKVCAVTDVWSGLKLVIRKELR